MTSLVAPATTEVAHAPEMSAAESFSQSSTRVEKPSEVEPSAAEVAAVTPPVWKFAAQAGSLLDPVY